MMKSLTAFLGSMHQKLVHNRWSILIHGNTLTKRNLIKITVHNKLKSLLVLNLNYTFCMFCLQILWRFITVTGVDPKCFVDAVVLIVTRMIFHSQPSPIKIDSVCVCDKHSTSFPPTQQSRTNADQQKSGNLQFSFSLRQVFFTHLLVEKRIRIVNVTLSIDQINIQFDENPSSERTHTHSPWAAYRH